MSSSSADAAKKAGPNEPGSEQQVVAMFQSMKQELQGLASKLGELEMDKEEHMLVINTIKPLDPARKCFRLVGGVLMERTVREVLPALESNVQGINQVMQQLAASYKKKEEEMQAFQKKYDIRIVPQSEVQGQRPVAA